MAKRCRPETLTRNPTVHIDWCRDCGALSVHVGPVSLRLQEGAARAVRDALTDATRQLDAERSQSWLPQTPGAA
ncbi:MAG: hypothetical protein KC731_19200 [Myxococcales bacterium]|mgnify:CR=1 FL=1|nr:hypothetical protein [Myxococcales bacterium]